MFDCAPTLWPIVDTKARICVRQSLYSVPAGLSRRRVEVRLARSFAVIADAKVVARHQRSLHKGTEDLVLDHYLEILVRKPGALPGSTALAQARSSGTFGPIHNAFWEAARRRLGDGAGTRALIGGAVVAPVASRRRRGGRNDRGVAHRQGGSRRGGRGGPPQPPAGATPTVVVPIGDRLAHRPAPTLSSYDELLEVGR